MEFTKINDTPRDNLLIMLFLRSTIFRKVGQPLCSFCCILIFLDTTGHQKQGRIKVKQTRTEFKDN